MTNKTGFLDENFYKLIDLVSAHVYWKDKDGRYLGCNRHVLEQFGLTRPQELVGKSVYEILLSPENEVSHFIETDRVALKYGIFEGEEYATISKKGVTFLTKKVAFFNEKGDISGLMCTSVDITNQKKLLELECERRKVILEEHLKVIQIIDSLDASIYWKDQNAQKYLGCNRYMLDMFGIKSREEILGKTDYDLMSDIDAQKISRTDKLVLTSGSFEGEEHFKLPNGEEKTYLTIKKQLIDSEGNVTGLVGTFLDITYQKKLLELEREKIIIDEQLKITQIIDSVNASIYWKDRNGLKYLGCNRYMLNMVGLSDRSQIIGKTDADLIWKADAASLTKVDNDVISHGSYIGEEKVSIANGTEITVLTVKNQLVDSGGNVIGVIGTSLDITAQKETECLKLENESQRAAAQEQEKFRKIVDQVAHDIRSPLASLLMIVKASQSIPEKERIALREAAITIGDIANNLLSNYQKKEADQSLAVEDREPILISPVILQILTDKKYQYQNLAVKFDHHFSQAGNFSWINVQPTAFKRMLSNITNNAVDAFAQNTGRIILHLDADEEQVHITVEDNGKGMSQELVQKIMNQIAVTEGKSNGHGIGLTQVRETLQNNEGQWLIDSKIGVGTSMRLTFSRTKPLDWIAETVPLHEDDTVVILDDDNSIHLAWTFRFEQILKKYPDLILKHFENGQEAIDFINGLHSDMKPKVFLLSDYELLKQSVNGLDVINKTQVSRSILVTSHYANKNIRQLAITTGTKILPKQLASDIPILLGKVNKTFDSYNALLKNNLKKVDVIFVDDEQTLLDGLRMIAFGKQIETYRDPQHFLNNVNRYPKNTKIMLDQHFANFGQKGIEIAERLHTLGFTQLYLLSGGNFDNYHIPDYLTVILKTDLDSVEAVLNKE
ncbi:MAG: hypothetical protein K0R08_723 [Solimicrobium sp.]|jgi:PAS domain S-box-containing protein|nr:hypothetical protein [Solimicrobium sp.]